MDKLHQIRGEQSSIIAASKQYFGKLADMLLRFEMRAAQR